MSEPQWFEVPMVHWEGLEPSSDLRWFADQTYVRCFDEDGKEFLTVDRANGLRWLVKVEGGLVFFAVDETCLPAGRWKFTGKWLVGGGGHEKDQRSVVIEGVSDGVGYAPFTPAEYPWAIEFTDVMYVGYAEFSDRISLCRGCEFYDHDEGVCGKSGLEVFGQAIDGRMSCPLDKWLQSKDFDPVVWARDAAIAHNKASEWEREHHAVSEEAARLSESQADFDAEWESRRAR